MISCSTLILENIPTKWRPRFEVDSGTLRGAPESKYKKTTLQISHRRDPGWLSCTLVPCSDRDGILRESVRGDPCNHLACDTHSQNRIHGLCNR